MRPSLPPTQPQRRVSRFVGRPAPVSSKVTIAKVTCYGTDHEPLPQKAQLVRPWSVMTVTTPPVTLSMFATLEDAYAWAVERSLAL